jgi:hypothetical protein
MPQRAAKRRTADQRTHRCPPTCTNDPHGCRGPVGTTGINGCIAHITRRCPFAFSYSALLAVSNQ